MNRTGRLTSDRDEATPQTAAGAGDPSSHKRGAASIGWGEGLAMLIGAGIFSPLVLYAAWLGEAARTYRLLVYAVLIVMLLLGVAWGVARLVGSVGGATASVAVWWLVLSMGGRSAELLPGNRVVSSLLALVLGFSVAWIVLRLAHLKVTSALVVVSATILIGTPLIQLASAAFDSTPPVLRLVEHAGDESAGRAGGASTSPDVWFVVLDGYPSSVSLAETFRATEAHLPNDLETRGFDVNHNAISPYGVTHLAIPSLLNGYHIAGDGDRIGSAEMRQIHDMFSGDNTLFRELGNSGYEVTIVENGFKFNGCGTNVDQCVKAPAVDQAAGVLFGRSLFGGLTGIDVPWVFAHGAEANLAWMRQNAPILTANDRADAVFVHLLAPHPPLTLDADCAPRPLDRRTGGLMVAESGMGDTFRSQRRDMFVEQVQCVTAQMLSFIDSVGPDTVVAVVGDHGPDSLGQSYLAPSAWTIEMARERMLTLAALRLPEACSTDLVTTMDVSLAILKCLLAEPVSDADVEAFHVTGRSIGAEVVVQLPDSHQEDLVAVARGDR